MANKENPDLNNGSDIKEIRYTPGQNREASMTAEAQSAYEIEDIFERLSRSKFRSRFSLNEKDKNYVETKGMETIRSHAEDFISKRLAPAEPVNDGKQTPMRGHPVFIAQHATATCCRGCLEKWHKIPQGKELTSEQQEYVVDIVMTWIERQMKQGACEK